MPANLPPDYHKAEERFRQAKTVAEKIAALEEMYALLPKHKGTDKIQADIRRKMAKFRQAAQQARGRGGVDPFHVEKHGAGQLVLVGTPNCGKSALVRAVSGAHVKVAPYPFSTHGPAPGMMPFEDIQIQLVDLPPVTRDGLVPGMLGTVRASDGVLVCVDLSAPDLLEQMDTCLEVLAARGVVPHGTEPPEGGAAMKMLLVGTKVDRSGAAGNFEALADLRPDTLPMLATSAETGQGLEALARRCFEMLGVVRVYSKEPGKPADMDRPFVLPRGSTVLDLAGEVHRDFAEHLKRARIWGDGVYDGQPVQQDRVLSDKDVIELHV